MHNVYWRNFVPHTFMNHNTNSRLFTEALSNFIVGLTDTPISVKHPPSNYTLCANHTEEVPVGTIILTCQPIIVSGQFLFVRRIRAQHAVLTPSEVQVYSGICTRFQTEFVY